MDELIISIFCELDNFCRELNTYFEHFILPCEKKKFQLEPSRSISSSEIMMICVVFHLSYLVTEILNGITPDLSKKIIESFFQNWLVIIVS